MSKYRVSMIEIMDNAATFTRDLEPAPDSLADGAPDSFCTVRRDISAFSMNRLCNVLEQLRIEDRIDQSVIISPYGTVITVDVYEKSQHMPNFTIYADPSWVNFSKYAAKVGKLLSSFQD